MKDTTSETMRILSANLFAAALARMTSSSPVTNSGIDSNDCHGEASLAGPPHREHEATSSHTGDTEAQRARTSDSDSSPFSGSQPGRVSTGE
jgi:hypothetical protein